MPYNPRRPEKVEQFIKCLGTIKYKTEKAILFVGEDSDGFKKEVWIPKSQCRIIEKDHIVIKQWIADRSDLEGVEHIEIDPSSTELDFNNKNGYGDEYE